MIFDSRRLLALAGWGLLGVVLNGCDQAKVAPPPIQQLSSEKATSTRSASPMPPLLQAANGHAPKSLLPVYELKINPKDLASLDRNPFSNDIHPATFLANGVAYEGVRVRFRGQWARTWPKRPFKIFFDHAQLFEGQRTLNLNSGWRDPAFIRETLAYRVYAACGVPAPKSRMVRLHLNGQFRGLYVEVEQPDKAFLTRLNLKGASVFKAASKSNESDERDLGAERSFSLHYDQETEKAQGAGALQSFCHDLARTKDTPSFFAERVDLERYINYLAATILIQHWDCLNKNHFLVYDGRVSKKWFVVPWDLDRTFGDHWHGSFNYAQLPILLGTQPLPGPTGWNRLEARFFSEPTLQSRLLKRLAELLEKEFTTEKLFPILDRLETDIAAEATLDRARWPSPTSDLHTGIADVKNYIKHRRAYLLTEMGRLREDQEPR